MSENPRTPAHLPSGNPTAAAVAWPWRAASTAGAETVRRARRSALRREGTIRALAGGAVGAVLFALGAVALARVAGIVSGLVLLAALVSPGGLYAAIGRALAVVGRGVGRLLAVVFLTPVFFLFFLPFGKLLRSGHRDRLERWFDRQAPTYWHRRADGERTRASYEKAF